MPSQSNANFKTEMESIAQPYSDPVVIVDEFCKTSNILDFLFKTRQGEAPLTGLETFNNDFKKFEVNNYYPYTKDTLVDMAIEYGDEKNPTSGKHLVGGEVTSATFGHTQGITKRDMIRLQGYSKFQKVAWYDTEWKKVKQAEAINITNSIYNGTGSVTRTDGQTRNDFVGLMTAIGNGTYASINYATDNVPLWRSQGTVTTYSNWAMNSVTTIFGMTIASAFLTCAASATVPSGGVTTPAWDLLSNAIRKCQANSPDKTKFLVVVPPWFYDYCFVPSLKAMASTKTMFQANQSKETALIEWGNNNTPYTIHGVPILAEDCSMVTSQYGSIPSFIFPEDKILILNMNSVHLGVNPAANFKETDWQDVPTQYGAFQRSFDTTLAFWVDDRWSNGVIDLYDTLVSNGKTIYGIA
jgi:hypothetical protein